MLFNQPAKDADATHLPIEFLDNFEMFGLLSYNQQVKKSSPLILIITSVSSSSGTRITLHNSYSNLTVAKVTSFTLKKLIVVLEELFLTLSENDEVQQCQFPLQ